MKIRRFQMTGKYNFADKTVYIDSIYPNVHDYCKGYESDKVPDIRIKISEQDILFEKDRSEEGGRFPDYYLEELAVYRKICEQMPYYDAFLFHGSCISVDGEGYLFGAPSGTGKSTHAKIWCDNLGDRAIMVNDDKPLLKVEGDYVYAYGTPYNGKHHRGTNMRVKLKAICMLYQSPDNTIRPMDISEAYPLIIGQTYRTIDRDAFIKTLDLVDMMFDRVKIYSLGCNMEREAFEVSYGAMSK